MPQQLPRSSRAISLGGNTLSMSGKNHAKCIRMPADLVTLDTRHMALADCTNRARSNVQSSKLNIRETRMFKRPTAYVLKATRPCAIAYGYSGGWIALCPAGHFQRRHGSRDHGEPGAGSD